jgi:GT2 family glycosyltransferase
VPLDPIVASFRDKLILKLIRQDNAGPASARNTGAAHASGDFLAFIDDDCQPDPQWLQTLADHLAQSSDCLMGGQTINDLTDNLYSEASQLLVSYIYHYYNAEPHCARFFASNNIALAKEQFYKIGGFNITFPLAAAEDREFCERWLYAGYRMMYVPKATVYHSHYLTLKKFWWQHFNYGRGAFRFHQIHAQRGLDVIQIEPIFFYLKLLVYPFIIRSNRFKLLHCLLLFFSQIANAAGFFWQRWFG